MNPTLLISMASTCLLIGLTLIVIGIKEKDS